MSESGRRFVVVSESGRTFTVIEYSTYRWERSADGSRCQVANDAVHLMTKCGLEVVMTDRPGCYRIPALELTVDESHDDTSPSRPVNCGFSEAA